MKQRRDTKQRQMVLEVVQSHHDHPRADDIYLAVRERDDKISRGTVYRNLRCLAEDGKITHVKVPGADRYDCRTDRHYHLICTKCGAVIDAPTTYAAALDDAIQQQTGYRIERHRTVFEGVCAACQAHERQE